MSDGRDEAEGKKGTRHDAYVWHLSNERWEAAMEAVDDDNLVHPKTLKQAHEKFLRGRERKGELGHKKGGNIRKKNGRMARRQSKRQEEP